MKVLHINCNYIGTTLHQRMIEHLSDTGVENSVFVATYDKSLSVIKPNDNVTVVECFRKWDRIIFDYKQKKIYKSIKKLFDPHEYDCIHAYTLFTDGNNAMKLSMESGIPYVVAIRNTDVNEFFKLMPHLRKRGVEIMRKASAVFFLSEEYKKIVFEKYLPTKYHTEIKNKTYILPNGIDDYWFNNVPSLKKYINPHLIELIYAGRIDKNKNIQTTQKAMAILRKKGYNLSLKVIGKIEDKKVFTHIMKDKFTLYEKPLSKEKLCKEYRMADIFIMPSFTESFGLVYAEAMSQGLPVIYSKGQGFDNQFEEGQAGVHVDANNPYSVAEGIEEVIKNYDSIAKNVIFLSKKFQWENIVNLYKEIYYDVRIDK